MDGRIGESPRRNRHRIGDSGRTRHFEFVCQAVAQGIKDVNVQTGIPVIFCVLTDDTKQQALDRSGGKHGNKGVEAAVAAVKMAALKGEIEK